MKLKKQRTQNRLPEFTAKLVTDTFEVLVNANLTQMEAYSELLEVTGDILSN